MLTRTVALPIFGKLCDMYPTKRLFKVTMGLFILTSLLAGMVRTMPELILLRTVQGLAAGGTFAVAYTAVVDVSPPEQRGRMMGLISFVWGVASVLGPVLGGVIVTYVGWPWVFYINVPVGGAALIAVLVYLREFREKRPHASIDYLGAALLSSGMLALLFGVLLGGVRYTWLSPQIIGLLIVAFLCATAFLYAESRAADPIVHLSFFRIRDFVLGSVIAFFCSFAIFSLIAFIPLFVQGALSKPAAQVSIAMIPLSLGWSVGGLICGNVVNRIGHTVTCIFGALVICIGIGTTLSFSPHTSLMYCCVDVRRSGDRHGVCLHFNAPHGPEQSPRGRPGRGHLISAICTEPGRNRWGRYFRCVYCFTEPKPLCRVWRLRPLMLSTGFHLRRICLTGVQQMLRPGYADSSVSPEFLKELQDAVASGVIAVFWLALAVGVVSVILSLSMLFAGRSRQ